MEPGIGGGSEVEADADEQAVILELGVEGGEGSTQGGGEGIELEQVLGESVELGLGLCERGAAQQGGGGAVSEEGLQGGDAVVGVGGIEAEAEQGQQGGAGGEQNTQEQAGQQGGRGGTLAKHASHLPQPSQPFPQTSHISQRRIECLGKRILLDRFPEIRSDCATLGFPSLASARLEVGGPDGIPGTGLPAGVSFSAFSGSVLLCRHPAHPCALSASLQTMRWGTGYCAEAAHAASWVSTTRVRQASF